MPECSGIDGGNFVWGAGMARHSPPTNVAGARIPNLALCSVEFVIGFRPCSERFFSWYSAFPLSSKTNISKFQFDLKSDGHRLFIRKQTVKFIYLLIYLFID